MFSDPKYHYANVQAELLFREWWARLNDEESGLYYIDFPGELSLVHVIVGARCTLSKAAVTHALGSMADGVKVTKARGAYDRFEMVEDEKGL